MPASGEMTDPGGCLLEKAYNDHSGMAEHSVWVERDRSVNAGAKMRSAGQSKNTSAMLAIRSPTMVERAGEAARFDMKIHPHMLRHAYGFKLANDGVDTRTIQAYLGHKSIQHTVRYTELAPTRFKSLFRD